MNNQPPYPPPGQPPYPPGGPYQQQPYRPDYASPPQYQQPYGYPPANGKPNFGQQAAKASWVAPIIAVALNLCTSNNPSLGRSGSAIVALFGVLLYLTGLTLGIVALTGVKKYGRQGVVAPAITGICVSGGLLLILVLALVYLFTTRP